MLLKRSIGCFLITLVISCTHRSPQQRLADFINDPENKIVQSVQVGDVKVIAKWLPYQYRNAAPTSNNPQPDEHSPHEDYCYFNVRFEKTTADKPSNDKVLYLNFDMQNDFTLLCAGDSLSPVICQRIQNGISGSYEYMLAFVNGNKGPDKNDFTLYYKDKIFGLGVIAFVYSRKDIRKIPGR
jgi:hypothetical protein